MAMRKRDGGRRRYDVNATEILMARRRTEGADSRSRDDSNCQTDGA